MRPIRMHDYGKMLRILNRLPFFADFSHIEQLELIKAKNMFVVADPQEQIVRRGAHGNSFYVVVSGKVGVLAPSGEDDEPVAALGPGDVFGEVAFLSGTERTADVVAVDQSILFWLDRHSMAKLQVPLREKIKDQLIGCLVERLHDLNRRLYGPEGGDEATDDAGDGGADGGDGDEEATAPPRPE